MYIHLLVQWKGIPDTATTGLYGGGFHLTLCNLGIPSATVIVLSTSIVLIMHYASSLGIVCLFFSFSYVLKLLLFI